MWRFLAPRWLLGHIVVVIVAATFVRLGWWQWEHARQGNTLSYGYALQWPLFAAFGIFFWFRIMQDQSKHRRPVPPIAEDTRRRLARDAAYSDFSASRPVGSMWTFRPDLIPPALTVDAPAEADGAPDDAAATAYNDRLAWLNADLRRRLADYEPADIRRG